MHPRSCSHADIRFAERPKSDEDDEDDEDDDDDAEHVGDV